MSAIQRDREAFFRFTDRMISQEYKGAVLLVPYGEALIYPYYWEGLAALSLSPAIDAVGAQSNFSFPAEKMLGVYREHGGDMEKLRLWGDVSSGHDVKRAVCAPVHVSDRAKGFLLCGRGRRSRAA